MTPDELKMLAARMEGRAADPAQAQATERRLRDSFARLDMTLTRLRSGQTFSVKGADGKGLSGISLADAEHILASLQEAITSGPQD